MNITKKMETGGVVGGCAFHHNCYGVEWLHF